MNLHHWLLVILLVCISTLMGVLVTAAVLHETVKRAVTEAFDYYLYEENTGE